MLVIGIIVIVAGSILLVWSVIEMNKSFHNLRVLSDMEKLFLIYLRTDEEEEFIKCIEEMEDKCSTQIEAYEEVIKFYKEKNRRNDL